MDGVKSLADAAMAKMGAKDLEESDELAEDGESEAIELDGPGESLCEDLLSAIEAKDPREMWQAFRAAAQNAMSEA